MIREATSDDLPAAEELSRVAFAELRQIYAPSASARERAAATSAQFTRLVAIDRKQQIVGTLLYGDEGDRIHVRALAVRRDARRQSVARALLERVRKIAAAQSKRAVSLYTVAETDNVETFEHLGFQVVWLAKSDDLELAEGGKATEVYMELPRDSSGN
jgi:ribosomal protein S18 acetylase RimI-like enzyme